MLVVAKHKRRQIMLNQIQIETNEEEQPTTHYFVSESSGRPVQKVPGGVDLNFR